MKILRRIASVLLLLLVVVLIVISFLPSRVSFSRSVSIHTSQAIAFAELQTFRNFNLWSPWARMDSLAEYEYSGPLFGKGNRMAWESEKLGNGAMLIVDVQQNEGNAMVLMELSFESMEDPAEAGFYMESVEPDSVLLTWTYDQQNVHGLDKIMGLLTKYFVGPQYESGLRALKRRLESFEGSDVEISLDTISSFDYLAIESSSFPEMFSSRMAQDFGHLMSFVGTRGVEVSGYQMIIYQSYEEDFIDFKSALPVSGELPGLPSDILLLKMDSCTVIKSVYHGDYLNLPDAHEKMRDFANFANFIISGDPWEEYMTDPVFEPDTSLWATNIYYPIR